MFRQKKSESDTPVDGDFASCVERLSGAGKGAPVVPPELQRKAPERPAELGQSTPGGSTGGPGSTPAHELVALLGPLSGALKMVRAVLLLFVVVQAVALVGLGKGAWPSLLVTALAWWTIGRVVRLTGMLGASGKDGLGQKLALLQERFTQLAEKQRKTGKTK